MSLPIVNKVNTREYSRLRSVGINVKGKTYSDGQSISGRGSST